MNRFGFSLLLAAMIAVFPLSIATNQEGFFLAPAKAQAAVVSSIEVEGNQRIEDATVISYLTVVPGREFSARDLNESLQSLFATGLFADVRLERRSRVLFVFVEENPIIRQVVFEGNRRLDDGNLGLVTQLEPRRVLTESAVQSDTQRILEAYRRNGRFGARVEPKIIEVGDNRVDLVFEINEDERSTVSRITFIGNQAFSDGKLRDTISTEQSGLLSFLSSSNTYDPDRLDSDRERLRRFYLSEGYADFRVVSAVAELDREQNAFFITFTVDEGPRYEFGSVEIDSSLRELDPEDLYGVIETRPGDTYDADAVDRSIEALTLEVSRFGFAFVQVRPRGDRDPANQTIDITYFVDEGVRAYVERINITGNTRTRDSVIRREFDFAEGDAFNRVLVDRAERRLNATGFFEAVRIRTQQGSAPDRVILNVAVVEQSTGDISFGAGISSNDGVTLEISITERNFLGRGQYVRAAVGGGLDNNRNIEFSFTEPYFLGRRLAAGFDLYRRESGDDDDSSYTTISNGGALRVVAPITNDLSFGLSYGLDITEYTLDAGTTASRAVEQLVGENPPDGGSETFDQSDERLTSSFTWTLLYDTIDNRNTPREGYFVRLRQQIAGAGGDAEFIKTTLDARAYRTLSTEFDVIGSVRVQAGNVVSWDDDNLLIVDGFFQGANLVRGFDSFGPRDGGTGDALGGTTYAGISGEVNFPVPVLSEAIGLRGAVFADAGTLFDPVGSVDVIAAANPTFVVNDDSSIRSSVGASLIWNSPFGPLRADYAFVLSSEDYDEELAFRFSGGARF
ncbi:MAG: outer membrane protein assembly factor BamA [Pseudomonadota bacterium]